MSIVWDEVPLGYALSGFFMVGTVILVNSFLTIRILAIESKRVLVVTSFLLGFMKF